MSRLWTDNSTDRVWTDNSTDRVWTDNIILQVNTPTFDIPSGTYSINATISLFCATSSSSIYYTINGSTPTSSSTLYTTPINIFTGTLKVIAIADGYANSEVATASYVIAEASDWSEDRNLGPWDFTEQPDKWGYLNNPRWANTGTLDDHIPCGHWHKHKKPFSGVATTTVTPYTSGRWRAGKEQTDTDYIVMFDEHQNNVVRLDVSGTEAKIQHILDVDISWSYAIEVGLKLSPHPEKGGHCITEDGNTAFYLLRLTSNDDCWLVEVDLSGDEMVLVRKTFFSGLYTYNIFDDEVSMDMVASDDFVFLATSKESGRIIKFDRTDHSILIDKEFGYATALAAEGIGTLMINDDQLYWTHVRRPVSDHVLHIVTGSFDLVMISEITESGSGFSSPLHNAFLRLFDGYIYYARQYYPGSAPLRKYNIDLSSIDQSRSLSTMILDVWVDNIYIYYLIGDIDNDPIWLRKRPIDNFSTLLEETDVTAKVHKYDRVTAMNYKKHRLLVGDSTYVTTDHYINHISLYNNSLDFISTEDFPSSGTYDLVIGSDGNRFPDQNTDNEPQVWAMPGETYNVGNNK